MNNIVKPAIILALVAFVSSMVLSHIKKITYPSILKQEKEKQERALAIVLPGYTVGEQKNLTLDGTDFTYWPAEKDESGKMIKGYAFIASSPGYSGQVVSMVGVDDRDTILGMSILQQSETPGLGARSIEVASSSTFFGTIFGNNRGAREETRPWFQLQFTGLNAKNKINIVKKGDWNEALKDELASQNAVSAITGATITSRATIKGIEKAIGLLHTALERETVEAAGKVTNQGGAR
ncbi:MAG TPA: FMN-binding protein [Spirochaetota bacterium]|nr:FMN-binding protein [Spirochaetota bacterium]HPI88111.1 FMN-binding protein [Spirochaetota bacterium]HPR46404.1 FMN-binding protein [Spirochaetota bacterium]